MEGITAAGEAAEPQTPVRALMLGPYAVASVAETKAETWRARLSRGLGRPVELTLGSWGGDNREGATMRGGSVPRIVEAALGGTHSCLLDESGRVYSFGRNSLGRLGRAVSGKWSGDPAPVHFPPAPGGGAWRVTSVCAGGRHTMATARVRSKERLDAEEAAASASGGSRPRSPLLSQSPSRRTSISAQQ